MAFSPRAPFRFCLQYLMSDSAAAAAAVADWQPAAVANCLFRRRGLEGGHRRRTRRRAAREINFNTRNGCPPRPVDSEDNASECRKNVVRLLLLIYIPFSYFSLDHRPLPAKRPLCRS